MKNRFFGPSVTVSGLITAGDLIERMRGVDCQRVLITQCMLRDGGDRFLDDVSLKDACARLGKPIVPVGRDGADLLGALLDARPLTARAKKRASTPRTRVRESARAQRLVRWALFACLSARDGGPFSVPNRFYCTQSLSKNQYSKFEYYTIPSR